MSAAQTQPVGHDTALVLINFNTASHTLACLRSLAPLRLGMHRVLLIDNASGKGDLAQLREGLENCELAVDLRQNQRNIGFAGAADAAIRELLADARVQRVLLLNNDAVALPAMRDWMAVAYGDMCSARVMKFENPELVDSLGIVMYRSGLASNRMHIHEPLLGPTGGCAIYSRRLLEDLVQSHGHSFDPSFFCYAEDTDLAMRALLLGYHPTYFDDAVALHDGQASSGGGFNDFVLYHGIRNSIWVLAKDMPFMLLFRWLPWIAAMYLAIPLRHLRAGNWRVVARLYRDAALGLPARCGARRKVLSTRRLAVAELAASISTRFYSRGAVRAALRELVRRRKDEAS
jgi:GT2 family glycosyltransferase